MNRRPHGSADRAATPDQLSSPASVLQISLASADSAVHGTRFHLERRSMAQLLTLISLGALAVGLIVFADRLFSPTAVHIDLHLDREAPGAQLIWDIRNATAEPITIERLIVHGARGITDTAARGLPALLAPGEQVVVLTDVDWSLLAAKTIAVTDTAGREYHASRRQLATIQGRLRHMIDRRVVTTSAHDFLMGAANLAFGMVILGLGVFMLMWVIATG
jgi:hypothetical protein